MTTTDKPNTGRGKTRKRTMLAAEEESGTSVDSYVGGRVRLRRTLIGMSQEKLGEAIGLTFQQVQKYERGANRISASMLHKIAQVLDVPISFFFDGLGPQGQIPAPAIEAAVEGGRPPSERRETLELVRAYSRITESSVRDSIMALAKSLANHNG
ncbi:helix-turn-helix protein [Nitrospirillum amazonense]|jgi:transcriptional regulator with XRE-family HTH domain|uniref:Helix-turn-helix protein n=2 Tax=Nitrospirillum amazonense TaxID=28077 RepID=A0A560F6C5_9PROT|nr:helix-turn-helix protein [Nitrospirillum amazonense]